MSTHALTCVKQLPLSFHGSSEEIGMDVGAENDRTRRIRELNDALRQTFDDGRVVITPSVRALPPRIYEALLKQVREFDVFTEDDDPYHEHDFGLVELGGHRFIWKIEGDNKIREHGCKDSANQDDRLLIIMRAEEYEN